VLAFSRGAAVAFVLMLLIMVLMRIIKFYQLAITIVGIVLLLSLVPQYAVRLNSITSVLNLISDDGGTSAEEPDGAIKGRATVMWAALQVFADHPIIGVGPGMVKYYTREYGNRLGLRYLDEDREAHSLYLAVAADNGLLGFISFMGAIAVTIYHLLRTRKYWLEKRPELANTATAFMLAIVAYMTTGLFLHLSYIRYFWLVLALGGAASYVATIAAKTETQGAEKQIE
jgi:O-antigen ligase